VEIFVMKLLIFLLLGFALWVLLGQTTMDVLVLILLGVALFALLFRTGGFRHAGMELASRWWTVLIEIALFLGVLWVLSS
jgi:hypothetical protein